MSRWQEVKDFVNSKIDFTKKDMRVHFDGIGNTESQYILLMLNAEFIQRTGHGKYKRLITIPNNISSSLMQELAYNTEKRNKIMMILKRKEKLNKIKESQI